MDQHYRWYATSTFPNMGVCQYGAMPLQVVGTSDVSTSSMLYVHSIMDQENLLRRFVVCIASDVHNMTCRYVSRGCYDIIYTGYSAQIHTYIPNRGFCPYLYIFCYIHNYC